MPYLLEITNSGPDILNELADNKLRLLKTVYDDMILDILKASKLISARLSKIPGMREFI